jgi:integrase/recombinase XerD
MTALPVPSSRRQLAALDQLAAIPEEEIWLAKQTSPQTRRAYRVDVRHFMRALGIANTAALRQVDHRAVIAWERMQREQEAAKSSTVRRRLAALSSFFKHLVRHGVVARNPLVDVERPTINRIEGSTAAVSEIQARKILDAPAADTLASLRDRAILSVGLQVGFRRAEIAALRVVRKCGRREALAINPQAAQGIRAYLEIAGHGDQLDAPLFRPVRGNRKPLDLSGRMDADAIDRMVRKYAAKIGLARGYSAHSMWATFITTALENGAQLEDVQKAARHRDPSTTKLYDRRGYNPEKAASFFATY